MRGAIVSVNSSFESTMRVSQTGLPVNALSAKSRPSMDGAMIVPL
jgi:hypothetical protein